MADYKEDSLSGTTYQRCRSMYFENPRNRPPSLLIREERVINLGDRTIEEPAGEIVQEVGDFSIQFPLRNPLDNELIPGATMSYQDLYVGLFSLYWYLAEERDAVADAAVTPD